MKVKFKYKICLDVNEAEAFLCIWNVLILFCTKRMLSSKKSIPAFSLCGVYHVDFFYLASMYGLLHNCIVDNAIWRHMNLQFQSHPLAEGPMPERKIYV